MKKNISFIFLLIFANLLVAGKKCKPNKNLTARLIERAVKPFLKNCNDKNSLQILEENKKKAMFFAIRTHELFGKQAITELLPINKFTGKSLKAILKPHCGKPDFIEKKICLLSVVACMNHGNKHGENFLKKVEAMRETIKKIKTLDPESPAGIKLASELYSDVISLHDSDDQAVSVIESMLENAEAANEFFEIVEEELQEKTAIEKLNAIFKALNLKPSVHEEKKATSKLSAILAILNESILSADEDDEVFEISEKNFETVPCNDEEVIEEMDYEIVEEIE